MKNLIGRRACKTRKSYVDGSFIMIPTKLTCRITSNVAICKVLYICKGLLGCPASKQGVIKKVECLIHFYTAFCGNALFYHLQQTSSTTRESLMQECYHAEGLREIPIVTFYLPKFLLHVLWHSSSPLYLPC